MKEKTLKLLFYLKRGTKSKAGKSPIMARLSVGRTMVQFSCKTACSPSLWDSRKHRLVGKSAEAVAEEMLAIVEGLFYANPTLRRTEADGSSYNVLADDLQSLRSGLQQERSPGQS